MSMWVNVNCSYDNYSEVKVLGTWEYTVGTHDLYRRERLAWGSETWGEKVYAKTKWKGEVRGDQDYRAWWL